MRAPVRDLRIGRTRRKIRGMHKKVEIKLVRRSEIPSKNTQEKLESARATLNTPMGLTQMLSEKITSTEFFESLRLLSPSKVVALD